MNKEAQSKRIVAALLASGICLYGVSADAAAQEDRSAQREIERSEIAVRHAAEENAPQMSMKRDHVHVSEIAVTGTLDLTPEKVLSLLPELKQDEVSIKKLSMQIQTVNDTGALVFVTEFTPDGAGAYRVLVHADAQDNDHFRLGISNTGTKYTGQVRSSLTYVNNNVSGEADTLGVSSRRGAMRSSSSCVQVSTIRHVRRVTGLQASASRDSTRGSTSSPPSRSVRVGR